MNLIVLFCCLVLLYMVFFCNYFLLELLIYSIIKLMLNGLFVNIKKFCIYFFICIIELYKLNVLDNIFCFVYLFWNILKDFCFMLFFKFLFFSNNCIYWIILFIELVIKKLLFWISLLILFILEVIIGLVDVNFLIMEIGNVL